MNKPKPKFSPAMAKLLRKIDINTRAIAKLHSAREWATDALLAGPMTVEATAFADAVSILSAPLFALTQQRRNLKLQFEDEWKRLQTSA